MGREIIKIHCKIMDNKLKKILANFYLTQTDINHFYNIGVKYDNINIREVKKSKIKKKLIEYLDGLEYESIKPDEEIRIHDYGFKGSFIPYPRK